MHGQWNHKGVDEHKNKESLHYPNLQRTLAPKHFVLTAGVNSVGNKDKVDGEHDHGLEVGGDVPVDLLVILEEVDYLFVERLDH